MFKKYSEKSRYRHCHIIESAKYSGKIPYIPGYEKILNLTKYGNQKKLRCSLP
jgi:hypothetical protein